MSYFIYSYLFLCKELYAMITCDEVYFDYDNSSILENINFTINKGEFVVIMGSAIMLRCRSLVREIGRAHV